MMNTTRWFPYYKPNPQARLRLFCFPYAGAGSSVFRTWSAQLAPEIEVCPVQLPGRENRLGEPPFTHISPLVETLTEVLLPYLDRPFAFFGHSVGALISFELARQLRRQNVPQPMLLLISGRYAPQIPPSAPPLHQLPDPEFIEELRRYNGTPELVLQNRELMALLLPIIRADLAIAETYVYTREQPLDCPISAFGGIEDPEVSRDELAAWQQETRSTFTLEMFPGDHFFLKTQQVPLLESISEKLSQLKVSQARSLPRQ